MFGMQLKFFFYLHDLYIVDHKSFPTSKICIYKQISGILNSHVSLFVCLIIQTVKSPKGLSGKICPREVPKVIRLSQGAQPQGKVSLPKEPLMGKFFRQSLRMFHCLSDVGLQKPKKMRPRVAP